MIIRGEAMSENGQNSRFWGPHAVHNPDKVGLRRGLCRLHIRTSTTRTGACRLVSGHIGSAEGTKKSTGSRMRQYLISDR